MAILMQMFTVFVIKVYFYLIGEEVITRHLGKIINLKTIFDDTVYECTCQEITFRVKNRRLMGWTLISRVYKVTMKAYDDEDYTHQTYPMLCSEIFRFTKYPHMLAIKSHYRYYYT